MTCQRHLSKRSVGNGSSKDRLFKIPFQARCMGAIFKLHHWMGSFRNAGDDFPASGRTRWNGNRHDHQRIDHVCDRGKLFLPYGAASRHWRRLRLYQKCIRTRTRFPERLVFVPVVSGSDPSERDGAGGHVPCAFQRCDRAGYPLSNCRV